MKGFIYTSISIIFVVTIILLFSFQTVHTADQSARIRVINDFLDSFHKDVERAGYISAFRTFVGLEEIISDRGSFVNDCESAFSEIFYNGTYNGTPLTIMNNSKFSDYMLRVNREASALDISIIFKINNVLFYQDDPWNVHVNISSNIDVNDNKGLVAWRYNKTFSFLVPIQNLKDPVYSVNTNGKIHNFILISNYTDYVNDTDNSTYNLQKHINGSYYVASSEAPNFMMRFEGNLSPDENGIESMVDLALLASQDLTVYTDRSILDYQYFSNQSETLACNVTSMLSWFKIDKDRVADYEIDKLNYTIC